MNNLFNKVKKSFLLLLLFFLFFPYCNPEKDQNENMIITKWRMWSEGTKLRGVNIWQKKIDPELDEDFIGRGKFGPTFTVDDFKKLSELGVNYVNISHPGIFTEDPPYLINPEALLNLKSLVEMIGKADMFAVISLRTGPGRSEYTFYYGEDYQSDPDNGWFDEKYYNEKVWESFEIQSAWVSMWEKTAEEFKNNPYVVGYDLMVEPNSAEIFFDISEPDEFFPKYEGTTYDWNNFFPGIVEGIREVDISTPVIVGGQSYSDLEWLPYTKIISDERIIYSFHQYSPFRYTHQNSDDGLTYPGTFDIDRDGVPEKIDREWLLGYLSAISDFMDRSGKITAANEYGGVRFAPGIKDFFDDEMNEFEKFGINYAIWEWSTSYELFRREIHEFNFMMGTDPSNREDIDDNPLLEVLKKYWSRNIRRPSNTDFIYE